MSPVRRPRKTSATPSGASRVRCVICWRRWDPSGFVSAPRGWASASSILRAYDRETDCDWVTGSFMLVRRDAVAAAGMMDERYFLYSEEPDLCRGLQAEGWAVRYVPEMTIVHYEGPQSLDSPAHRPSAHIHAGSTCTNTRGRFGATSAPPRWHCSTRAAVSARKTGDPERDARRRAARAALRTLLALETAPFGALSGPLRGPGRRRHRRASTALRCQYTGRDRPGVSSERDRLPRDGQRRCTLSTGSSAAGNSAPWSSSTAGTSSQTNNCVGGWRPMRYPMQSRSTTPSAPTLIDDRYFAKIPGIRGRLLRRMPPMIAQLTEILIRGRHYDAG